MAAIVSGASLGLTNSSLAILGAQGQVGSATHGASGERVYLNGTTGNLVIQRRDELVVGVGNDLSLVRTYNSQGRFDDDNGDNWRIGVYKRVTNVNGTLNAANSSVTRVDGDAAESIYWYDAALGLYVNTDGDGAFDTLRYDASTQLWTWTDGSTQMKEEYEGASGRIKRSYDPDGNAQVYTYNAAGLLTQVVDASGQTTALEYIGNNLRQLKVTSAGQTLIRTRYQYDGLNRLYQVSTDFSPANTTEEPGYVVTYTYDGTSKRVASIIQTDGNNLAFSYYPDGRLQSFTDANGKTTSISYTQDSASQPMSATVRNGVLSTTEPQTTDYPLDAGLLTNPAGGWQSPVAVEASSAAASQLVTGASNSGDVVAAWLQGGSLYASDYESVRQSWSAPVLVSGSFTNISAPQLDMDHQSGNAILTWIDTTTNRVYAARGLRTGPNGESVTWQAAQLVATASGTLAEASGSINGSGASAVLWRTVSGTTHALNASRLSGSTWTAPQVVATGTAAINAPQMVVIADGVVQVVWRASDGTAESLFTRGWNPSTAAWGSTMALETSSTPVSLFRIDTDIWEDTNVAWVQGNNVYVRWGGEGQAWSDPILRATSPAAVTELAYSDSAGNAVVAWLTTSGELYAHHYSSDVTQRVVTATGLTDVSVDVNGPGDALISWRVGNDLYASRFVDGAWSAPALIESASGAATTARVAVSEGGAMLAVWQQSDGTANSIFAARYLAGAGTGSPYYTVQAGDSWESIGQRLYGNSAVASALQSALGNPPLTPGAQLTGFPATLPVTVNVTVAPYYTVPAGATWTSITQAVYDTSHPNAVAALQAAMGTPLPTLTAGAHLTVPPTLNYSISVSTTVRADITDPLNQVTSLFYDANGQIVRALTPAVGGTPLETRYTYDGSGNVTQVTDGKGNVVTYEYDARGSRILERDAAGNTVKRTYSTKNELLTETLYAIPDPDGAGALQAAAPLTTRYVYDGETHLRFVVSPEGRVTEYQYSDRGEQIAAIRYTGNLYSLAGLNPGDALTEAQLNTWRGTADKAKTIRTDNTYDFRGQLLMTKSFASVDAAGNGVLGTEAVRQYVYDPLGNVLKTVDPRGVATTAVPDDFTTTYVYDGLGRVLSTVDALGRSTLTQYQDANRKTVLTFADGLVSTSTYDATGKLTSVLQSSAGTGLGEIRYFYDAKGRLRRTEDPTGIRTHILYDEAGRKVGEIDGDGSLTEYRYDAAGNLTRTLRYATPVSAANLASLIAADGKPTSVALAAIRPVPIPTQDPSTWNAYDSANRLVKSVDELGFVTERIYDGAGRVTKVVRYWNPVSTALGDTPAPSAISPTPSVAEDRITRNFYDAEGNLLGRLDGEGYLIEYRYDAGGRLVETVGYATVTNASQWAAGTLAQLRPVTPHPEDIHSYTLYNPRGQIAGTVDGEGYLTEYVYDAVGNKTQVIRYATKVTYTAGATVASLRPTVPNAQDRTSTYGYDALNRVTSETNPEGTQTQYVYDEVGNLTKTIKAANFSTETRALMAQYDKQGRVTAELSAKGAAALSQPQADVNAIWAAHSVKHTYDAAGRRTSTTDANGERTLFYYNADGKLTHTINAFGEVKESVYDPLGQLTNTIEYDSRIAATALTTLTGGLVGTTSPTAGLANATLDSKTEFGYDVAGRVVLTKDPLGNAVTQAFNAFGEVASRSQALGDGSTRTLTQKYGYDDRGLLKLTASDENGINATVSTDYDAFGRAKTITDANNNVRLRSYDRLGRMVTTTDPLNKQNTFTYDAFDRVLTQRDALGKLTTYSYDPVNRSVTVTTPEGLSTVTTSNRHGETVSVRDGRGNTTNYVYDENGNLKQVDAPGAGSTIRAYDNGNRLTSTTDALGTKTLYEYDPANRLFKRTVDEGAGRLNLVTTYEYDAKGQTIKVTDPANVVTRTDFDPKGQVKSVVVDAGTGRLNLTTKYTYDARGNTLTVTEGEGSANPKLTRYDYDVLGRRTSETLDPNGLNAITRYVYDKNGNVTKRTDALGSVTRYAYDVNDRLIYTVDALGGVTKNEYDANGRLTRHTAYANAISLTGLSDAPTLNDIGSRVNPVVAFDQSKGYVYDGDGREIFCIDSLGGVKQKIYDGNSNLVRLMEYANPIPTSTPLTQADVNNALVPDSLKDRLTRTVYDAANRPIYEIDAAGYVTQRVYDNSGKMTKEVRYFNALQGSFTDNVAPQIVTAAPASGSYVIADAGRDQVSRLFYDAGGRMRYGVDAEGYVTERRFDALGHEINRIRYADKIVVADGATTASVALLLPGAIPDSAVSEEAHYDSAGRLFETIDGERNVTRNFYDAVGRKTDVVRAYGTAAESTTKYEYDSAGRLFKETRAYLTADAATTRYELDALGNRRKVIDPRGVELAETDSDWASATRKALGVADPTLGLLDATGNAKPFALLSVAQKDALLARYTVAQQFDELGRKKRTTDALGYVTVTEYDTFGNAVKVTDPRGNAGYFYFNRANQTVLFVDPEGYATQTVYDAFGNVKTTTRYASKPTGQASIGTPPTIVVNPAKDQTTLTEYDRRGLKLKVTNAEGYYEEYVYDAFGNKTRSRNLLGGETSYTYDRVGNMRSETLPVDSIVNRYEYDARGNRTMQIEADGRPERRVTTFKFDKLDREVKKIGEAVHVFDEATLGVKPTPENPIEAHKYDARGNLIETIAAGGARTLTYYDARDRKVAEIDALGGLTKWEYNDGDAPVAELRYGDAIALPAAAGGLPPGPVNLANVREKRFKYDANNALVETSVPDTNTLLAERAIGQTQDRIFTQEIVTKSVYDGAGNEVQSIDARGGTTFRYYDKTGHKILEVDGEKYVTRWEYDAAGNVVRETKYAARLSLAASATSDPAQLIAAVADAPRLDVGTGSATTANWPQWRARQGVSFSAGTLFRGEVTSGAASDGRRLGLGLDNGLGGTAYRRHSAYIENKTLYASYFDGTNYQVGTVSPAGATIKDNTTYVVEVAIEAGGTRLYVYEKGLTRAQGWSHFVGLADWGQAYAYGFTYEQPGWAVTRDSVDNLSIASGTGTSLWSENFNLATDSLAFVVDGLQGLEYSEPNRVTELDYDRMNRVTERRTLNVAHGTVSASGVLTPATAAARTQIRYNGLGQITQQIDGTGAVTDIGYDLAGRKTKEQDAQFTDFEGAPVRPTTDLEYDALNQVSREIKRGKVSTDDRITSYQYDYGFGARLIGITDAAGSVTSLLHDVAGNTVHKSLTRTNADNVASLDRATYTYDALGRERQRKVHANAQTPETRFETMYNAYGEITGKRTNGGAGVAGAWQETAEYDAYGRVWKSNSGDGSYKVYLYDASGNATLTIQSAGADFSGLSLAQVMALPNEQKFLTISQYDARNALVGTWQPKMNGNDETASVEQFITQQVRQFSGGTADVGPIIVQTPKSDISLSVGGAITTLQATTLNATWVLRYSYTGNGTGMENVPYSSLYVTLPKLTDVYGAGNYSAYIRMNPIWGNGAFAPGWDAFGNLLSLVDNGNGTVSLEFWFKEWGSWPNNGWEPPFWRTLQYWIYFTPTSTNSAIYLGSQTASGNGPERVSDGEGGYWFPTFPHLSAATGTSFAFGANELHIRDQGPDAQRVIFQYRPTGSTGGWSMLSIPQYAGAGSGRFAVNWSAAGIAAGSYEFQYTTLDANGKVLNSRYGTVNLGGGTGAWQQNALSVNGAGRVFMDYAGRLNILGQGTAAQSVTLRYRHKGSSEAWTPVYLAEQLDGVPTQGWFQFNPAASGMSGEYEYWIEAKDVAPGAPGGTTLNKAKGTFTVGVASSVSPLLAYQDQRELVHFRGQPETATRMTLSYRRANTSDPFSTPIELQRVAPGTFDWDAGNLAIDNYADYRYEYRYQTFDGGSAIVNQAHGVLRMGANPGMETHDTDHPPTLVRFQPPQVNATKMVLRHRAAGSSGAYSSPVTLTRASGAELFTWDASSVVAPGTLASVEYIYDLFDSANAPVKSADGIPVTQKGVVTVGTTSAPTSLKYVVVGGETPGWSIHRQQKQNAFGEIVQEIDGRGNGTDFRYNSLGRLIEKIDPRTSITLANGFKKDHRPRTRYTYDLAGRLVAVQDANGNLQTQALLAGTGLDGSQPLVLAEYHADRSAEGGVKRTAFDVFRDARTLTDEIGRVTRQEFDKLGRLIKVTHPARAPFTPGNSAAIAVSAIDTYAYDQAGNRIKHTNALLKTEKTYYDSLGRVTDTVSFNGGRTSYRFVYDSTILGVGGRQVGGWVRTTTEPTGNTMVDNQELFGRVVLHKDFGNHSFTYTYNHAGWLIAQAGTTTGQDIVYEYYANGYLKAIDDRATRSYTKYAYDEEGNRTLEAYLRDPRTPAPLYYQLGKVEYDELNRVKRVWDAFADIRYEYDANGNRRRVWSYYHDGVNGNERIQDYWYAYDSMNRFVVTMGQLSGPAATSEWDTSVFVTKGSTGIAIGYNRASERTVAISADGTRENYIYTADGYLELTKINDIDQAFRFNDLLGRVVKYQEYNLDAEHTAKRGNTSLYDDDSNLKEQELYEGQVGNPDHRTSIIKYDYLDSSPTINDNVGQLWQTHTEQLGQLHTNIDSETGNENKWRDPSTFIDDTFTYDWWDTAKQKDIKSDARNDNAGPDWKSGWSHFQYDVNGHLVQMNDPMAARIMRYVTNAQGLILVRDEVRGGQANSDGVVIGGSSFWDHHVFYYLDGKRVGDVGNNGPLKISYAEELAREIPKPNKDPYRDWKPISSADFDQNYEPINSSYPGATSTLYTVRPGENLQSIAAAVWGDSTMWYLIADANGLSGASALTPGQRLTIPNKVTNIHNTSETYKVYDPGEAVGNTSPTLPDAPPPPPRGGGGCGGFGAILILIIIIVVAFVMQQYYLLAEAEAMTAAAVAAGDTWVAPALVVESGAMSTGSIFAAGAVGGAVGSAVGQGVMMMTGYQEDFDFKQMAMAAIGGGINAAVGASGLGSGWGQTGGAAVRAATASALTQGTYMALGWQSSFSWKDVAFSAAGAAVSDQLDSLIGGPKAEDPLTGKMKRTTPSAYATAVGTLGAGLTTGLAATAVTHWMRKEVDRDYKLTYSQAARNSVASVLGNSLAEELVYGERDYAALSPDAETVADASTRPDMWMDPATRYLYDTTAQSYIAARAGLDINDTYYDDRNDGDFLQTSADLQELIDKFGRVPNKFYDPKRLRAAKNFIEAAQITDPDERKKALENLQEAFRFEAKRLLEVANGIRGFTERQEVLAEHSAYARLMGQASDARQGKFDDLSILMAIDNAMDPGRVGRIGEWIATDLYDPAVPMLNKALRSIFGKTPGKTDTLANNRSAGAASAFDETFAENRYFNPQETARKHGEEPRIVRGEYIGKRPENGEFALDNSVQISENSSRRIGVDVDNHEIVIFDRTKNMVRDGEVVGGDYHGHVRPVDMLTKKQLKVLEEAGFEVSKRGRITVSPDVVLNTRNRHSSTKYP